jgi:Domain of unknown function (DUF4864)
MRRFVGLSVAILRAAAFSIVVGLIAFSPRPAHADDAELLTAARAVIEAQIAAFKRDDGFAAYSYTAPEVQTTYRSADGFLRSVRTSFPAMYRPRSYNFQAGEVNGDGLIVQRLDVVGPDGTFWLAEFFLRDLDGDVKIGGCRLTRSSGAGV